MFRLFIHKKRIEKHISQEELALMCNLSQNYISMLERNVHKCNPTLDTIEKIAQALQVCPLSLIECYHCSVDEKCRRNNMK
jgi:transcriptional regulator with XRE-family HTH domain